MNRSPGSSELRQLEIELSGRQLVTLRLKVMRLASPVTALGPASPVACERIRGHPWAADSPFLTGLLLGEECYFSPYGLGRPRAYKLQQVCGESWRFLLEGLFAGGLKRKPQGLQEGSGGLILQFRLGEAV